jgi:hypothetical protein
LPGSIVQRIEGWADEAVAAAGRYAILGRELRPTLGQSHRPQEQKTGNEDQQTHSFLHHPPRAV